MWQFMVNAVGSPKKRISPKTARPLLIVGAVTAALFTVVNPAQADVGWARSNLQTGLCLDGKWNGDVYTNSCNDGDFQIWATNGHGRLLNAETFLCLDSDWNGKVYALGCNGGDFQIWDGGVIGETGRLINHATGRCLDSNESGRVYTLPCNPGNYQFWGPPRRSGARAELAASGIPSTEREPSEPEERRRPPR
jgi:serine/threonine-protein kinase